MASDTLKQIADNLGVTTINGNYLSGIADYYGVDLATSDDLMADILTEVGGNPANSTDYLQDIVLALGGTVTINGNWMEAWEAITAVPPAPVNTIAPVISGTTTLGSVLTTTDGTWTNSPTSFAYQWKRGATNIGTNANTYTLVVADTNQNITCVVTATNAGGSTPATSNIITVDNPFISTFRTTGPSETVTLPYEVAGTYSGTIDWGDATTSTNSYANRAHVYLIASDYVITVTGVTTGFKFGGGGDRIKIRNIINWGTLKLGNGGAYFNGCTNLTLTTVNGILNLTGTTTMNQMFRSCSALTTVNNMNSWNTSAVTNMSSCFLSTSLFNSNISSWNTGAVTTMGSMFESANSFNQNIGGWNTGAVTNMSLLFYGTPFNQNIGSWNVANVTNFAGFMATKTTANFSTANLDAIYNGWSASGVKPNITISFNIAKFTNAGGLAGKTILLGAPNNWIITDGGGI
jgi:surface protein